MLTLNDGRSELWQWDTGRNLDVDADCTQVHFSNKVFGRSVDVDVVDGVASIPDILLQTEKDLTAWAFVGTPENGYTKISKTFKVNKRNKPADYVFTPPEQTTLGEILERLDDIESAQDPDAIKNAVNDYLDKNPIRVEETDPTVPAWAKQPTKPGYTVSEVGAVATVNGIEPDEDGNVELEVETAAPDWNAAEGEPGHIKNRTHYTEYVKVALEENKEMRPGAVTTAINYGNLHDVDSVEIVFDGVTYNCPVTSRIDHTEYGDESYFYIGNRNGANPEYPFLFFGYIGQDYCFLTASDGAHTVSAYKTGEGTVHKLPEKYLPDSVVQVETVKKAVNPYFEGNIDGYTFLMIDVLNEEDGIGGLVKITDYVLTEEECLGATVTVSYQGLISNHAITKKVDFTDAVGLPCDAYYADGSSAPYVVVIKSSGIGSGIIEGVEVSAGTYYLYVDTSGMDGGKAFSSHFSALDNKEVVEEKINPKYLPSEVAFKSDIPSVEGLASEEYVNDAIANLPTGGGSAKVWRKIAEFTLEEDLTANTWFQINNDADGSELDLLESLLIIYAKTNGGNANAYYQAYRANQHNVNYVALNHSVKNNSTLIFHCEAIGYDGENPIYIRTTSTENAAGNATSAKTIGVLKSNVQKITGMNLQLPSVVLAGTKYEFWGVDR